MGVLSDSANGGRDVKSLTQNPIVMVLLAILAGGGTAVGYRHSPFSDPFPGKRGAVVEERIDDLEKDVIDVKAELRFVKAELSRKPPQDLLDDIKELKQTAIQCKDNNEALKLQITRLEILIITLSKRGHISPNDLLDPGRYGGGSN